MGGGLDGLALRDRHGKGAVKGVPGGQRVQDLDFWRFDFANLSVLHPGESALSQRHPHAAFETRGFLLKGGAHVVITAEQLEARLGKDRVDLQGSEFPQ